MERIFSVIERIRGKSEAARWALAAGITLILASLLVAFWIWNLSRQFANLEEDRETKESLAAVISPLESVRETIAAVKSGEDPEVLAARLKEKGLDSKKKEETATEPGRIKRAWRYLDETVRYNWDLMQETFGK